MDSMKNSDWFNPLLLKHGAWMAIVGMFFGMAGPIGVFVWVCIAAFLLYSIYMEDQLNREQGND